MERLKNNGYRHDIGIALIYDGSFDGFLCALLERGRWRLKAASQNAITAPSRDLPTAAPAIKREGSQLDLFEDRIFVPTDTHRAEKAKAKLVSSGGPNAFSVLDQAFRSDFPDLDDALAFVARSLVEEGPRALENLADPRIRTVVSAALRTRMQTHLYAGILRFSSRGDGWWFARIEPDCDVLPGLGDHFAARFPTHQFVVHDARRDTALVHVPGKPWRIFESFLENPEGDTDIPEAEKQAQEAWRRYFSTVSIAERRNDRLQANHLPRKYRKHVPEFLTQKAGTKLPE